MKNFPEKRDNIEVIFLICITTTFMGQAYFTPFSEWFRLSFAPVILPILLLFFTEVSAVPVCLMISILIILFRSFIEFYGGYDLLITDILLKYSPVAFYYVFYGILFTLLKIRDKLNKFVLLILSLWICDTLPNIMEVFIRNFMYNLPFEKMVFVVISIGLFRALTVYLIYKLIMQIKRRYDKDKEDKEYRESLLFLSKLKTEIFFLKKSTDDIEHTMDKSYQLYSKLQEEELKGMALDISRNIHEIKKDYTRVITGLESTLENEDKNITMYISDIFEIIEDSMKKLLKSRKKDIELKFISKKNVPLVDYVPIVSLLNNLITNSMEAMKDTGSIVVEESHEKDHMVFSVTDDGPGIDQDDLHLIFEPGFSTKYDKATGKMSTGIGLSHVKKLVEEYYRGSIDVESSPGKYTSFTIKIPINRLG